MPIVLPPREVFEIDPESIPEDTKRMADKGYGFGGWIETRCPDEGGMYAYYEGLLYPYKGHPWTEAVDANNRLKRFTLQLIKPFATKYMALPMLGFALTPWKWKIRFLEDWLEEYWRMFSSVMVEGTHCYVLQRQYYNNCSKELWDFISRFLCGIGISERVADQTGKIVATMIEWDDAYRLPIEDIFSITDKCSMMENPRREIGRMIQVYAQRSLTEFSTKKYQSFALLLQAALRLPKIRKAFTAAMSQSTFANFQLDNIDYYHVLYRHDYNFLGRELEDRAKERRHIELTSIIQVAK